MVNFWLPIPVGAASFVSLKVTPHSGIRAVRSAFSGMFTNGKPDDTNDAPAALGAAGAPRAADSDGGDPAERPPGPG
jgi:hypothetical protein